MLPALGPALPASSEVRGAVARFSSLPASHSSLRTWGLPQIRIWGTEFNNYRTEGAVPKEFVLKEIRRKCSISIF